MRSVTIAIAHEIKIYNNCSFTIWPGVQGNLRQEHFGNGGFSLDAYNARTFTTSVNWSGRIWGRTKCNHQGKCETGDCGKMFVKFNLK